MKEVLAQNGLKRMRIQVIGRAKFALPSVKKVLESLTRIFLLRKSTFAWKIKMRSMIIIKN